MNWSCHNVVLKKVSLQSWIKSKGGAVQVAASYGFKTRTVNAWLYLERYPRPKSILIINKSSGNQVDFKLLAEEYSAKHEEKL
jgi:hypothetical protein